MKKISLKICTHTDPVQTTGWIIDQDLPYFPKGELAVTRTYFAFKDRSPYFSNNSWDVTHIKTGKKISSFGPIRKIAIENAIRRLNQLSQTIVDNALKKLKEAELIN